MEARFFIYASRRCTSAAKESTLRILSTISIRSSVFKYPGNKFFTGVPTITESIATTIRPMRRMAVIMAPNREKQIVHTSSRELSLKNVSLYLERFFEKKSEFFLFRFINITSVIRWVKVSHSSVCANLIIYYQPV